MFHFFPYLPSVTWLGYEIAIVPLMTVICVIAYFLIAILETRRLKLNPATSVLIFLLTFTLYNIIGRIFFAFSHIFFHQDFEYQNKIFGFYTNQKVVFGFLFAQVLAIFIGVYVYEKKKDIKKYFDVFLFACTSLFFIRLGGALTHYPVGKITDSFWGNYYFRSYRHEPALYEAISLLILFFIALLIRKKIKTGGLLALIIVAWMSLSRVFTDFFRSKDLPLKGLIDPRFQGSDISSNFHFENGLTLNQVNYFLLFLYAIISIILILIVKKRGKKRESETNRPSEQIDSKDKVASGK